MVTFKGLQDSTFVFGIENYEFPTANDDIDANFLIATGHGTTNLGSWHWRDACLMTRELRELATWLRNLRGARRVYEHSFTEPGMLLQARRQKGVLNVTIRFTGKMTPAWHRLTEKNKYSYLMVCPETLNDFEALAADVDKLVAQWPERLDKRSPLMRYLRLREYPNNN